MPTRPEAATAFRSLHQDFLILPNAWDAGSAKLIELAGAQAIATSSAAVAWAHGYADGHHLPFEKLLETLEEIARVIALPISVDMEGGYSDDLNEVGRNVMALIERGAVGINIEDGSADHEVHLEKIRVARDAAGRKQVDLYINARTDVFLKKLVPAEQAVEEAIRRGRRCLEAGASGVFVPFAMNEDDIKALAAALPGPLNIMGWAGVPNAATLKALGVRRLSAATSVFHAAANALRAASASFLRDGDSDALAARGGERPDMNALMRG
jgi:2-methylisocitrate lyase-like PEP mutase family enzyme